MFQEILQGGGGEKRMQEIKFIKKNIQGRTDVTVDFGINNPMVLTMRFLEPSNGWLYADLTRLTVFRYLPSNPTSVVVNINTSGTVDVVFGLVSLDDYVIE